MIPYNEDTIFLKPERKQQLMMINKSICSSLRQHPILISKEMWIGSCVCVCV